jgi:pimeloyl-ACP methyl ester carboxylesterase
MHHFVEGFGIEEADLSLRSRGSNRLATAPVGTVAYHAARERRVLLIHGYNVNERSGLSAMDQLRRSLEAGAPALARQILTVTWPGNENWWRGGPAAYFTKVDVAQQAGRLLAKHILALHQNGMGAGELVLVAHSLGSRVVMECLRYLEPAVRPGTLKSVVVILMAAAVPTHLDALIAAAHRNSDRIIILHSADDRVLKRWFKVGQTAAFEGWMPEAIGHAGNPHNPPWAHQERMMGYDHGDYWTEAATADVIGHQLQSALPNVLYRPSGSRANFLQVRGFLEEAALTEYPGMIV